MRPVFACPCFKQRGNVGMVLRQIPNEFLSLDAVGKLPERGYRPDHAAAGIVPSHRSDRLGKEYLAGQRWSNHINDTIDHHIITIEDPIEFYHNHKKSTVNQREVGVDVHQLCRGDSPRSASWTPT